MIHRQNYLDVRAYLRYCEHGRQTAHNSVQRYRTALNHLLIWADDMPLSQGRRIEPSFPTHLLGASLAPASIVKTLQCARQFYAYARLEWPTRYKAIPATWVDLLQPPRQVRAESRLIERAIYTVEEVQQIAGVSTETLREDRAQVGVIMLFLSGMRADALASLPIDCVNVAARQILQLPERGVRTKNRKAGKTFLLEIPSLLNVVEEWDNRVRSALPADALWYATLSADGMRLLPSLQAYTGRNKAVEEDTRLICRRADVPYRSPHALRHGHVVWSLMQARTLSDLKAISQNVMHSSVTITDGTYGNLVSDSVRNTIARLGHATQPGDDDLETKLDELLELLRRR